MTTKENIDNSKARCTSLKFNIIVFDTFFMSDFLFWFRL